MESMKKSRLSFFHKTLLLSFLIALAYLAYLSWSNGYFALTENQKMSAFVRNIRYYQGRKRTIQNLFSAWSCDPSIIPRAYKYGDEIVPLLEKEIRVESNPFRDGYTKDAAEFILSNVIKTKASLQALINALQDGYIGTEMLDDLLGPLVASCSICAGDSTNVFRSPESIPYGFTKNVILQWYQKNKDKIVDIDYGIGLKMPDNTIRPLGYHGIETWEFLNDCYFFCTEFDFSYFPEMTSVKKELTLIMTPPGKDHLRDPDMMRLANRKFTELFDMRVASDVKFWPYYPIWTNLSSDRADLAMVIGYFDSKHRRHGHWRDIESKIVVGERWYFHGEEMTEDEYYSRGGYDLDISLPWFPADIQSFMEQ